MITIKFFAILKDRAGRNELTVPHTQGTVADLLRQLEKAHPALAGILSGGRIMVSINQEFVKQDAVLHDGDEVALMPPFSGGSGRKGCVRVQEGPFSLDQEVERLKHSSSAIGGIVTFLGTTRDCSRGRQVSKLEFEHY